MAKDQLKFVRILDVNLIPRYLLEQLDSMDAPQIDRFYQLGPVITRNPLNYLFVLADANHKIKGCGWARINPIEALWFVEFLSIDKEYQAGDLSNIEKAVDFLLSLPTGPELKKKIKMATKHPKVFEKAGWKKIKLTFMEYEGKEDVDDKTQNE